MRDTGLSASDVALLSGNNGRNGDGMFGDNGAWFIVLFLIFAAFGWGGNGWGNNRGNGSNGSGSVMDSYVLASDFATIQRQLSNGFSDLTAQSRYIQNGICDSAYENAQLINITNQNIANGIYTLNSAITNSGYDTRTAINNLSSDLASCCCQTQRAIDGVNYNMATNTCALQNTMNMNTRDIVDTVNANYRALHDEIVANRIEDKNAQIAAQQNEINALRLSASQANQNQYLIDQLKPCASPAYLVPNPNCCYNYNVTSGCNGCGSY